MRTPSIAIMRRDLGLSLETAREVKAILTAGRSVLAELPAGSARIAECDNPPATSDVRLTCLNVAIGACGVESFETAGGYVDYLNTGDTYSPTIVRYPSGTYAVTTWGDVAERRGAR